MTTLLTGGATLPRREVLDDDVDLARDRVLVTRAQEGDRTAFDDLYLRYYRRLYRFCLRRLHDTHEAEDVAQEAFSRAWRALPDFGGDRRFYPWLSVIASHLCTDVLRRRNRSTPVAEFHQSNVASTEDGGEELMVQSVDCDLVAKAFLRLSERHRRILNLREGSGWSYQRIADHEGVGITAVETLLWRARQALKREFAALAGSEGRLAGWAGGLFSLSMLRRILHGPVQAARRVGHAGPATAVAMGSAAAATAVVIATAVGSAPPAPASSVPAPAPVAAAGVTPAHPAIGGLLGASPRSKAADGSASSVASSPGGPSLSTIGLPGVGDAASQPSVPGVGNAVNGAKSTLDDVVSGLGSSALDSAKSQVAAPVTAIVQGVATAVPGSASAPASAVCGDTANPLSTLGGLLCSSSSALGTGG